MKSKIQLALLAALVFGILIFCGFAFLKTNLKLFFLIEGATVLAIILFILLYFKLIKPYQLLTDSIELMKAQDFSSRLRPIKNSEANKLIEVFNKMMDKLRNERLSVREKNKFLDLLIYASPQGVIILDFNHKISTINPSGLHLLQINNLEDVRGKSLSDVGSRICTALTTLEPEKETIIRGDGVTQYKCIQSSFIDMGFSHPFILIEELTKELLAVEKKSYEGLIRMMAHEVNNSIGAINATLNVVADIVNNTDNEELIEVQSVVDASSSRCVQLSKFINNLSEVVKIPDIRKTDVVVNDLLRTVERNFYLESKKHNISIELRLAQDFHVFIDAVQFEQVFINIIKNAIEAIEQNGKIIIYTEPNPAVIRIANNGPSITEDEKQNLFTPFFTTKNNGQGIGLMLVREILIKHNSKFDFRSADGWTVFEIRL